MPKRSMLFKASMLHPLVQTAACICWVERAPLWCSTIPASSIHSRPTSSTTISMPLPPSLAKTSCCADVSSFIASARNDERETLNATPVHEFVGPAFNHEHCSLEPATPSRVD